MNKRIVLECVKAFAVGAIIGLLMMYFLKIESLKIPIVFGIIAISIHARNSIYVKKE